MMIRLAKILLMGLIGFLTIAGPVLGQNRQRLSMNLNWRFARGEHKNADQPRFNDKNWSTVDVPHDWSIANSFKKDNPGGGNEAYLPTGIGWYRKQFYVPAKILQREVKILFDGIYMNSDVWINGHHLGHHPYGYTPFHYNLAPFLKRGENKIAVRVDNSRQPNTRWYSGSGIYRNVWMIVTGHLHITYRGVHITTPVAKSDSGLINIAAKVRNDFKSGQAGKLTSVLRDSSGKTVARISKRFTINSTSDTTVQEQISLKNPNRWSLKSPYLYTLHTTIQKNGKTLDHVNTKVGIRRIRYDTNKGFFLNGVHTKMKGVCLHGAGGVVGAAVPIGVWKRRLKILKSMGVNAIRTSHNPFDPQFLALCDKMGILVMDEAFDAWTVGKRKYDYHLHFNKWHQKDLRAMLLRDRNHPSIVMWSIGNEIPEQSSPKGAKIAKHLVRICHKLDATRPVTSACDKIADDQHPTNLKFMKALDIVGYNYADRWHRRRELYYSPDKIKFPNRKMVGTEDVNIYGARGDYSLGDDSSRVKPNYNANMIRAEQLWKFTATRDYVIGEFIWSGIDYLGESFWPATQFAGGSLDICGFKKDSYYFYKSQWTNKPTLHLFPYWNWPGRKGQIMPVLAYTNCDTVDLYVNGKFYGEKRQAFPRQGTSGEWNHYARPHVIPTTADLHLEWDVPYEPGTVTAVGRKNGTIISDTLRTVGKPSAIRLKIDHSNIEANNRDVVHVKCEIVDDKGHINPMADNELHFDISGPGKLIGVGSGNPDDHESHKGNNHQAFHGLALGIVQATRKAGDMTIKVTSKDLKEAATTVKSIPNPVHNFYWENIHSSQ